MNRSKSSYELKTSLKFQFVTSKPINHFGTVLLRCIQPAEYLKSLGYTVEVENIRNTIPIKNGIIIVHRIANNSLTKTFIKLAQAKGSIIIYDSDDLTLKNKKNHIAIKCDGIMVATEYLKNVFKQVHNDVVVIRNSLSDKSLIIQKNIAKSDKTNLTLGYLSGSNTHDKDFEIIEKPLLNLLKKYENLNLLIIGKLEFSLKFFKFNERFKYYKFMPYEQFLTKLAGISINLVPLTNSDFNDAKSELKYIEAGLFKIPSILSSNYTHRKVISHNITGILVEEERNWFQMLENLINDSKLRKEVGVNSFTDVMKNYTFKKRGKEYLQYFEYMENKVSRNSHTLNSIYYYLLYKILLRIKKRF